jgi:hypothetical protein
VSWPRTPERINDIWPSTPERRNAGQGASQPRKDDVQDGCLAKKNGSPV